MIHAGRTFLVAMLAAVLAVRVSLSQAASTMTQRIGVDPAEALRAARDPWSFAGTLGGASVQHLREVPYAAFLLLGGEVGVSAHAVETCWRALVLVLAVVGAVRLARGLAGSTDSWMPWAGAVVFALGAVVVSTLVASPTDGLAAATLPWVVAPLLLRRPGWGPAAGSAAFVGIAGVGSAAWALAAFGAGLVAALPSTRRDLGRFLRWLVLAGLASAWWVVLLAWSAVHAVDVSSLVARGLGDDVAATIVREIPFAVLLVVTAGPLAVVLSALLLRSPGLHRRFVLGLLGLSVVVVLVDRVGDWRPPVAAPAAGEAPPSLLAPLLGWVALIGLVAWGPLLDDLRTRLARTRGRERFSVRRDLTAVLAAVVVATTACASLAVPVAHTDPVAAAEVELLDQVAAWSEGAPSGRVLVLPPDGGRGTFAALGAALGDRPWVGRDVVPTSGADGTGALDDLITRVGRGDGGPGTLDALQRLGVSYVLLQLGGRAAEDRARPTGLVRAALDATGARRVAVLRAETTDEADPLVDFGVRGVTDQVEVWGVPGAGDGWVYADVPVDAVGGPGTRSDLVNAGVLSDRAVRLRAPSDEPSAVLSDSAARRDVDQRVPVDPYGPDLGKEAPRSVLPSDAAPVTSAVRQLEGASAVTASSSAADVDGRLRVLGTDAMAAIDGNPYTSWQTRRGAGTGEWWQVEFADPVLLTGTTVQVARNVFGGYAVSAISVGTDDSTRSYEVPEDGEVQLGELGESSRLRITVTAIEGTLRDTSSVGIVEVSVPGTTVTSRLGLVEAPAASWLLAARIGSRTGCVPAVPRGSDDEGAPGVACSAGLHVGGPDGSTLDRVVSADEPTEVSARVWLRASPAGASGELADRIARPSVVATASSVATDDLAARPQAAADADLRTAWRPAPSDANPELGLSWEEPADVTGLRLVPPVGDIGSRPTRLQVTAEVYGRRTGVRGADLTTEVEVAGDGSFPLPRVFTRKLTLRILDDDDVQSIDSITSGVRKMPVAIGEVDVVGGPAVVYEGARTARVTCSEGAPVTIDGVEHGTTLKVSAEEIVSGATVRASVCGEPSLRAGASIVTMPATFQWQPLGLLLVSSSAAPVVGTSTSGTPLGATPVAEDVLADAAAGESMELALGDDQQARTLVLPLPAGSGWHASIDDRRLDPVTVDGWSQGWIVPPGSGDVTVGYSPGVDVGRTALWASAGWASVVLLLAVVGVGTAISSFRRSPPPSRRRGSRAAR